MTCKNYLFSTPVSVNDSSMFEQKSLVNDLPRFLPINVDRTFFNQMVENCQEKRFMKCSKKRKLMLMPKISLSKSDKSLQKNALDEIKICNDLFLPDL